MRLVCVNDSGEVEEITDAIATQPSQTQSLVLDSVFSFIQLRPDTYDLVIAEHNIRKALLEFQGHQERYVRTYILTRSLDTRVEKTPRGNLIHTSFKHGGPIALLAIFYATFDAHRNLCNRETLDYFLNKASEEDKLALIHRTNTFPCSPSAIDWLERIFNKFDSDAQTLACILQWLGTSNIPADVFRRARTPSLHWERDGEATGASTRIVSLVIDEEKLVTASQNLEYPGFVKLKPSVIDMNKRVAELLKHRLQTTTWLPKVAKIVFHSIPKYVPAGPEENCVSKCEALLPHVALILGHLDDTQLEVLLNQMELSEVVEACLSISYFRDKNWKMQAVSIATRAIKASPEDAAIKTLLQSRVDGRRCFLSILFPDSNINENLDQINIPVVDRRTKAFAAELAIVKARNCVRLNQLPSALNHLENHVGPTDTPSSTQETTWKHRTNLMRARILRFKGHFQQAYDILVTLPQSMSSIWMLLSIVLCELGRYDEAIETLQRRIEASGKTRLRAWLGLAHAYFLKCVHALLKEQAVDQVSLQTSGNIYEDLSRDYTQSNYFEKMDYLSILMGLAAIKHMSGQVSAAITAWTKALSTSTRWLSSGYTDMIISYSLCELESREGWNAWAEAHRGQASVSFSMTGRHHHFPGLGSLWPDIIGKWLSSRGQDPVVPFSTDYLNEQPSIIAPVNRPVSCMSAEEIALKALRVQMD
ncbi:uncharacterized protein F4822DRAFT_164276 [Hypoxylon trugodes]|uniref:uncharacterized protein n=1 Tax=Hypoxylon trugodes TaxID=326681 RepID=UPI002197DEBC|nr:uncharacterized protein F4822DRAFT_164276 [Hypoxylon trugodes]KAI1390830.1 hypothetical protein F4822DRAFT_164276 [Hypoxylon trugodes]